MNFSITFGDEPDTKNTWSDWKLIPASPPMIPPPEPILNLVSVPGRSDPIDLSKYPFGKLLYQPITGVWSFMWEPLGHQDRVEKYEAIRRWAHGRVCKIRLEEDPDHYYQGRLTVDQPTTGEGPNQIDISYTISPKRYNYKDNTEDTSWVSDWHN